MLVGSSSSASEGRCFKSGAYKSAPVPSTLACGARAHGGRVYRVYGYFIDLIAADET